MTKLPIKTPLYFRITAAILSLLIFISVIELSLRAADLELSYKNQFFPLNRDIDFPEFYEKDSELFWKLRKNKTIESRWFSKLSYEINSLGLRGPEIQKEKTGVRILALGNSCTFGWGVSYESCWTTQLQNFLNDSFPDIPTEVINAGIPGYSSFQGKKLLENLLHLNSDIVLITYGWNDHWRAGKDIPDAEQSTPPQIILDIQNSLSKLAIYKLMRKITLSLTEDNVFVRLDDITGKRRVSREEFSDNLKDIINTAGKNGIKPILLVPPIASLKNYYNGSVSNFHLLHKKYQDFILRTAEYQSVTVVNLQKFFDNYNDLFDDAHQDPIHFNSKGHAVFAKSISPVVAAEINTPD